MQDLYLSVDLGGTSLRIAVLDSKAGFHFSKTLASEKLRLESQLVDCLNEEFLRISRDPKLPGNAIVGAMRFGEIPNTGHMQRVVFNDKGEEIRREMFLTEWRQRVREVRQGPDGLVYILTDENPGGLFRLEPAP